MKRSIDFVFAVSLLLILILPMLFCACAIKFTSPGPVIYWSDRVGKRSKIFRMPKFRTMRIDTPVVATHLLQDPSHWLTPIGGFLRKSSLDELPQLWSILVGDMSLVGPRPALHNQYDLIEARKVLGVDVLLPGLTGWAQINGRDELSVREKARLDAEYLEKRTVLLDLKIILLTVFKVLLRQGISH